MRRVNPYAMLTEVSWDTFQDWIAFADLEPFERDTYQLAHIAQLLWNINRDGKKYPDGKPLNDFLLDFDPTEPLKTEEQLKKQSVAEMEMMIMDSILVNNILFQTGQKKEG